MLTFEAIAELRERHPAWRLLRAQHAPLILSVLGRVFVEDNTRSLPVSELVDRLDDELHALRQLLGDDAFPLTSTAYITAWAAPEAGWLRLYYPVGSDEPQVDATPALERAVAWVDGLQERSFVGTESRLATVMDLLRQIVQGSETDPERRLDRLLEERGRLDEQIARARDGQVEVLGDTAQRERYQQFAATARELLADFREVEGKFRSLDREMRETIAGWDGSKGELLDRVLGDRNVISDSDQGRSFHAFYDFLLSADRQDELAELLREVHRMPALEPDERVRRIDHDWLVAADRTQATVRQISDQLRRFLDDRVWLENRRVMDLLRSIETSSLALRGRADPVRTEIDALTPQLRLPMERPLYSPAATTRLDTTVEDGATADSAALFNQQHVDQLRLAEQVRSTLGDKTQVDLGTVLQSHPIEQGLAELVGYLGLTDDEVEVVFDDDTRARLTWQSDDVLRSADTPGVLYVRRHRGELP